MGASSGAVVAIRVARPEEISAVQIVEDEAATMFDRTGLLDRVPDEPTATGVLRAAIHDGRLWVAVADADAIARDAVVGFALARWCGADAHLQELDVMPSWGRRGIGRRLLAEARAWAARHGRDRLTLTTFVGVPWNAPFYARLGFTVVPEDAWTPALRTVWEHERALGLPMGDRVVMAAPTG